MNYKKNIHSNYLFYALTFQVMDLILWFRTYSDANADVKVNQSNWLPAIGSDQGWKIGSVINLSPDGFAFFKPNDQSWKRIHSSQNSTEICFT